MPRPAGTPKSGGRKKGVPNKASLKRQHDVAASGLTPLDYMLDLLRDPANSTETRLEAAKAAAPYVHPKLAQIQHSGKDGGPIEHNHAVDAFTSRISRLSARNGEDEGDRDAH